MGRTSHIDLDEKNKWREVIYIEVIYASDDEKKVNLEMLKELQ